MEKFVYGGYVVTGGKFDDGREWTGVCVMLAPLYGGAQRPCTAKVYKGKASLIEQARSISIGSFVTPVCDMSGRIIGINVVE